MKFSNIVKYNFFSKNCKGDLQRVNQNVSRAPKSLRSYVVKSVINYDLFLLPQASSPMGIGAEEEEDEPEPPEPFEYVDED